MKKVILGQIDWGSFRLPRYLYLALILAMGILVARMVVYSPSQLIIISIGVIVILVCLMRTWSGLLLLLYLAPFYGFVRWTIGINPVQAVWKESMVILLTLGWAINKFVFKREKLVSTPINLPLFLLISLAIVQLFRSPNVVQGLFGLRILATYIPIYFITANIRVTKAQTRSVVLMFIIIGVATASYGLWQASVGLAGLQSRGLAKVASNLATIGQLRIFSTFAGPEYFGLYMVLMIILGVALLMSDLSRRQKTFLRVAIYVMVGALALTLFRLEWGMLGIGLILLSILAKKTKPLVLLVIVLVAVIFIFPPYVRERVTMTFGPEDRSFHQRYVVFTRWNIPNLLNHPLGVGLGSTSGRSVYQRVTGETTPTVLIGGGATESGLTNIGLEMGIAGLLIFVWLFVTIIRYGFRTFHSLSDPFLKWLAAGITAFTTSIFALEAFGSPMQAFPGGDLYLWFLVGLLTRLEQMEKSSAQPTKLSKIERLAQNVQT